MYNLQISSLIKKAVRGAVCSIVSLNKNLKLKYSAPNILTFEVRKQSIGILLCRVCLKSSIVMAGVLFEDIFNVKDIDPTGKQFDRGKCFVMYIVIAVIEIL